MGTYDDALSWMEENEAPAEFIEAIKGSTLRSQLEEHLKWRKEVGEPAVSEVTTLKKAPTKKAAFKALGVDYDSLPKYGQRAIDAFDWEGDEPDLTKVAEFAADMGFDVSQPEPVQQPAAAQFARQASAPAGVPQSKSIDDQIAEFQAAALDTSQPIEVRQKAQAAATALKDQKLRPAGFSATP